jgi:hypothetical protein
MLANHPHDRRCHVVSCCTHTHTHTHTHFLLTHARHLAPQTKLMKDVPTYKVITTAVVSERLKVTGSLARVAIRILAKEGLIKPIVHSSSMLIYTRATAVEGE